MLVFLELLHDREEDDEAGLHVEDARAVGSAVLVEAERHSFERSERPDCVEVAQHQSRPLLGWPGKAADQVVATVRVGDDLDGSAHVTQPARQERCQRVEGRLVAAGRLEAHQLRQAADHLVLRCFQSELGCFAVIPRDLLHAESKSSRIVRARIRSSIGSTPRPGLLETAIAPCWARIGGSTISSA